MSAELIQRAWTYSQFNNVDELSKLVPSDVSADASINSPTNQVHTLLMIAAASGADETCQYLLDNGAKVNKKNPFGFSALHWAAYCGRTECVELLIKAGASFDDKTQEGKNALHIAAYRGHVQFIECILALGADINSVSSVGLCAMHYAIKANQAAVARLLKKKGIQYDGLDPDRQSLEQYAAEFDRKWIGEVLEMPADDKNQEEEDEGLIKTVAKKVKKAVSPKK